MKFVSLTETERYLDAQVPEGYASKFPGETGMSRMKTFMRELGDPQEKVKIIHVAGTSGKGSTASIIASLLLASEFKVGLTVSPHLIDVRERAQINNEFLNENKYVEYFSELVEYVEKMRKSDWGALTYFEILTGFAYWVFAKEKVDYAVVETGLGGLLDGTNVVENRSKIAVITRIGLDHTHILGSTLAEIAYQKAGIVQKGNIVIALEQGRVITDVARQRVEQVGASELYCVRGDENYSNVRLSPSGTVFDFDFEDIHWKDLNIGMLGEYQAENASLALITVLSLARRDGFEISEKVVRETLAGASFMGRMSAVEWKGKRLIIDGAHNPQKMKAFVGSLGKIYHGEKFTFVMALKKNKDFPETLRLITPLAARVILTRFTPQKQGLGSVSSPIDELIGLVKDSGVESVVGEEDVETAMNLALENDEDIVVTGSLYLAGDAYKIMGEI